MAVRKTAVPFNLLVAGHTRAGKTDFIHTLFETVNVIRFTNSEPGEEVSISQDNHLFPLDVTEATPSLCAIECQPDPNRSHKISLNLIDSPGLSIPAGLQRAPQSSIDALERYGSVFGVRSNFLDMLRPGLVA